MLIKGPTKEQAAQFFRDLADRIERGEIEIDSVKLFAIGGPDHRFHPDGSLCSFSPEELVVQFLRVRTVLNPPV